MTINQVAILAIELKNKHSQLTYWSFTFNKRKRSFGTCNYVKKEIQLSTTLIPVMSDEAIKFTIIHEIAHALTRGHGHDLEWKRKCIELGGDGNRLGVTDKFKEGNEGRAEFHKNTSKYTLTCPTCGKESYRNRLPKRNCSCSEHSNHYNEAHKLVLTQNY